jgi:hypothetical protein
MTIILPSASIVSDNHEGKFAVPLLIKLDEQVSNWFINARVRLWKPMVEEIHNLEMRQQLQKNTSAVDKTQLGMQQQIQQSSANYRQRGQSSGGMTRNQDELSPRMPHDMPGHQGQQHQQVSFAYAGLPAHHHGLALSHPHPQQQAEAVSAGGGGVSLTLGLHQNNNRTYVAEPLPAALPHRFGLEDVSDAYVMQGTTSFGGQDRHFGKGMGGHHFVHDLVG